MHGKRSETGRPGKPSRSSWRRRSAVAALAATALAVPLVGVTAAPAAAATNCGSGNLGWMGYDVKTRVITVNQYKSNERTVKLKLVNDQISDHSFAQVDWAYKSGDHTWVDRSYDGGKNWTQCGPFSRSYSNTLRNVGNWMRACWRPVDYAQSYCTGWYYDKS